MTTSANPVDYFSGTPVVYATDVESDGFGQPWGVTRTWTGANNASLFGNGWANEDQPYLIIDKYEETSTSAPLIEVVQDGVNRDTFKENSTETSGVYSYTDAAQLGSMDKLVYEPPTPTAPSMYVLTDASGNVTTFYGLFHNPTDDGLLSNAYVYPQEPTPYTPAGDSSPILTYPLGGFASFKDTRGNVTSAQYDANGYMTEVDRSDPSGEQERFAYQYVTVIGAGEGAGSKMVSEVDLQRRSSASASWTTISGANYDYYTGDSVTDPADAQYGRLGDLKSVQTWNEVDGVTEVTGGDYYRYYKFWGAVAAGSLGKYGEMGPNNNPETTGGTDTTYAPTTTEEESDYILVSSGLAMDVQGTNYDEMVAHFGSSLDGVDSSDLQPYANNTFTYARYAYDEIQPVNVGTGYQVTSETSEGVGCSCQGSDGFGVFSYAYTPAGGDTNTGGRAPATFDGDLADYNVWDEKTVVTLPSTTPGGATGDDEDIVYTNEVGQVLMSVVVTGLTTAVPTVETTVYRYDAQDRVVMTIEPSAMLPYNPDSPASFEEYPDLVGYNATAGTYVNVSSDAGLINRTDYYATTTATTSTPGGVAGYVADVGVQLGYGGTEVITAAQTYKDLENYSTGADIYPVAASTLYRNTDGTGAETTTYSYTCATVEVGGVAKPTYDVTATQISQPASAEDGAGTADVTQETFDVFGRSVWSVDPDGYVTYTQYDPGTGAVVKQVVDADPATITGAPVPGPTRSPSLPAALQLITTYVVDGQGSVTEETDPNLNNTYTVYDDADHAVFVFPDATLNGGGTLTTASPIEMARTRITYTNSGSYPVSGDEQIFTYAEELTFTGTVAMVDGQIVLPTFTQGGGEPGEANVLDLTGTGTTGSPQFTIRSLSRQMSDIGGQVVESDDYAAIDNATYLATAPGSPYSGVPVNAAHPSGNYDATTYFYDGQGNQTKVTSPDGTIARTVYDGQARPVSVWVGTDDSPGGGYTWWSTAHPGNLTEIADYYYDDNGAGDGNLTETVSHPGGGQADRATFVYYDWRDRPVAEKDGALLSGGTEALSAEAAAAAHVPVTYLTYDNLDEVTQQDGYDGDGVAVTSAPPASDLLRSRTLTRYDDQGRVDQKTVVSVDPGTGIPDPSDANVTETYYDHRGMVMATVSPTSLWTEYDYDGAGRVTHTYAGSQSSADVATALLDGSFEDAVGPGGYGGNYAYDPTGTAWTFVGGAGIEQNGSAFGAASAPNGIQAAFLQTSTAAPGVSSEISQDVSLPAGTYTLTFDAAQRYGAGSQPIQVDVTVDGTTSTAGTITPSSTSFNTYTVQFTVAQAGTHTIAFHADTGATGDNDSFIDDVQLSADQILGPTTVLTQTDTAYDGDGNATETVTKDRFSTDSASATGPLGGTGGPAARVSYAASYYDEADRPVASVDAGTFGGAAYTPSTVYTAATVTVASGNVSLTASGLSGGSYAGYTLVVLTGTGAGERAKVTAYASGTLTVAASSLAVTPDVTSTFMLVDPASLVTGTTYTAAGEVSETFDPRGLATAYAYDALGRTVDQVANYTVSDLPGVTPLVPASLSTLPTPTDSANQLTAYAYDASGHVTSMTAVVPGDDQVTAYIYGVAKSGTTGVNDDDLLYQVQYPSPTTGLASSSQAETYAYDALGEQITYADRNGTTHAYAYDSLGRLKADTVTAFGTGVDTTVGALGYTYNTQGLLAAATTYLWAATGPEAIGNQDVKTYDGFGRLTSESQAVSGTEDGTSPTVGYTYDPTNGDRLTGIVYPNGRTVSYSYAAGLDSAASRVTALSDTSGPLQSYTYLGLATPVTFADGNGVTLSYLGTVGSTGGDAGDQYTGLDRFGRVVDQSWTDTATPTPTTADDFRYTYDADSNVKTRQNTVVTTQSETYGYDDLNRLITFKRGTLSGGTIASPTGTESWTLDALGNWQSSTNNGTPTTRTNSDQNQVNTVQVGTATPNTLAYDADGNTTKDDQGQQYIYDAWNRLVTVKDASSATIAAYTYDAQGRRVTEAYDTASSHPLLTTLLYSSGWQVLDETTTGTDSYYRPIRTEYQDVWSPFYVDDLVERDTLGEPGTDPNFGSGGVVTQDPTSGDAVTDAGVAVLSTGKVIVAATDQVTGDIVLFRYTAAGAADATFGTGGEVDTGLSGSAVALTVHGSTVYVAFADAGGASFDVAAFSATDGSAVSSFGTAGVASHTLTYAAVPTALTVDASGRLLVAGTVTTDGSGDTEMAVARFTTAGALDTTFGSSGVAAATFSGVTEPSAAAIAVGPTGRVAVGGSALDTGDPEVALAVFTSTGVLDTTFNSTGKVVGDTSAVTVAAATFDSSGRLVLAEALSDAQGTVVARYTTAGALDTTFGSGGSVTWTEPTQSYALYPSAVAVDGSGRTTVVGTDEGTLAAVRFTAAGAVDTTYGTGGETLVGGVASGTVAGQAGTGVALTGAGDLLATTGGAAGAAVAFGPGAALVILADRIYPTHNADHNVTSLTDAMGATVERYAYGPYGAVTVENADGTIRGTGLVSASSHDWTILHQGLRLDVQNNIYDTRNRFFMVSLGRFGQEDPSRYIDGSDLYLTDASSPLRYDDPSGLAATTQPILGIAPTTPIGLPGGRGAPPTEDSPPAGWDDIEIWFMDWVLEDGQQNPYFGPHDSHTQAMIQSDAAVVMRDRFFDRGCVSFAGESYGTGTAFINTIFDPSNGTQAFIGGFLYDATNNGDGTVTFTIRNQVSLNSFFYHIPLFGHPPRGGTIPFGGNVDQVFEWTEKIPCNSTTSRAEAEIDRQAHEWHGPLNGSWGD